MNWTTNLTRACGAVATVAGAATMAGWSGRTVRRLDDDRLAAELDRLDAEFRTRMYTQLEAARRYDRRFTVTSTELDGAQPADVALACARRIRALDAVTLVDGRLVALWWNSDRAEAAAAITRLLAEGVLPARSRQGTGAATFPSDGLTAVSLVEAAGEPDQLLAASAARSLRVVTGRAGTTPVEPARTDDRETPLRVVGH